MNGKVTAKIVTLGVIILCLILGATLPGCGPTPPPAPTPTPTPIGTPGTDVDGTSVTWSGNIYVPATVNVMNGGILTILPGTTIRFTTGTGIIVGEDGEGTLIADGDSSNKITFTGTGSTRGWWFGIEFGDHTRCDAGHTMMDNCIIEYTGYDAATLGRAPAAIGAWGSTVKLPLTNIEIKEYLNYGFVITDGAEFGPGSSGITIHDGNCPFSVDANVVRTIPADTQNLITNTNNVVEVGWLNDSTADIDGVWPKITYPVYYIRNHLNILCNLTIASGCTLKMAYGCRIDVGDIGGSGTHVSTLNCPGGTSVSGALFTAYNGVSGGWGGIWFYDNTFGDLEYVTVEKGGGVLGSSYAANIYIYRNTKQNTPTIQYSTIREANQSDSDAYGIVGYYHDLNYADAATYHNTFSQNGRSGTNHVLIIPN